MAKTKATPTTDEEAPAEKWTAVRVLGLLAARHPVERGEWAFFSELRSHTGYGRARESYFDAYAINCWPSSGNARVAYEIKVSRSDFLHEMADPGKRAEAMKVSNEFWYAAPTNVIRADEVPEGCGWLEVTTAGLRTKKQAPYREVSEPPLRFVASLLRWTAQASAARKETLSPREAKAFKYAGKELSVEELLSLAKEENDRWLDGEVARRLKEETRTQLRQTREYRLAHAVAAAMGRRSVIHEWNIPDPTDFAMWVEGQRLGGLTPETLQRLKHAWDALQQANGALMDVRAELTPAAKMLGSDQR